MVLLEEGAATLGLNLSASDLEQFDLYFRELKLWNNRINLTGLKTDRDILTKLFLDSLALLPFLGEAASLADLGSGAGFPGLVLKLARPKLALTLVESRGKKAAFLDYLVSLLKLSGVVVAPVHLTPRLAQEWALRFEAVVSRGAFSLRHFMKLSSPLLRPGGVLLSPRGPHLSEAERTTAIKEAPLLGLDILKVETYRVPFLTELRLLVVARKQK